MRVRHVESDQVTGTLLVKGAYADREEQKMLYNGVFYSQIDKSTEGKHIVLVEELLPEEFRDVKHQASIRRLQNDCNMQNLDSLDEMVRNGYRLFAHYAGKRDEYIVIARGLSIQLNE
jgi:hypothetical protein